MFKAAVLAIVAATCSVAVDAQEYQMTFKVYCALNPGQSGPVTLEQLGKCGIVAPKNQAGEKNANAASFGFASNDGDDYGEDSGDVFEVTVPTRPPTTPAPPTTQPPATTTTTVNASQGAFGPKANTVVTTTCADISVGNTSFCVEDITGMKAGDDFTISDGTTSETLKIKTVTAGGARKRRATRGTVTAASAAAKAFTKGATFTVTTAATTAAPATTATPTPQTATTACDVCNIAPFCTCVNPRWQVNPADSSLEGVYNSNCSTTVCNPQGASVGTVSDPKPVDTAVAGGCIFGTGAVQQCSCSGVGTLTQSRTATVQAKICVLVDTPVVNITAPDPTTPPTEKCKDDDYVVIIIIIIAVILIFVTCTSLYFCCKSEKGEKLSTK